MSMETDIRFLNTDVKFLHGVGTQRASLLAHELGITTFGDLLYYFPFRYIDRSKIYRISEISEDMTSYVQLRVRVLSKSMLGEGRKQRLSVTVSDGASTAELIWFQGAKWIEKRLEEGREYVVFGRPSFYRGALSMVHPEVETTLSAADRPKAVLQGVYSTTEKLSAAQLGTKGIYALQASLWKVSEPHIFETLPESLRSEYGLITLKEALYNIHFPQNHDLLHRAEYRLKFDELLGIQLGIMSKRSARIRYDSGFVFSRVGDKFGGFYNDRLPFPLTGAQKRVVKEIRGDTVSGHQMNRLLQGDVGSGKTLVALLSMLLAADNGFQSCMMAPTEILARQHYASITRMLGPCNVTVDILTGATRTAERREILERAASGRTDILIGTHALIEDRVQFSNLGLVVIDEQHRFGVEQRARLWTKNQRPPHILVMTATPIPRTLAMTLYGDLDVSVIDELPPGRKPIKTLRQSDAARASLYAFMRREIASGRQIYVVYPLIKESEKMDYKDLEAGYRSIVAQFPEPEYRTVMVHGKMKPDEKQTAMDTFKRGDADIMVATSVIEVGVDVPNATVMVIESAERFGLSQLNQLRGRVGRGGTQSYCVLMSGPKLSSDARKRLDAMVETSDGFRLSELDMKLRGSGDLSGTQQSGMAFELKIANLSRDGRIIETTRTLAERILERDPELRSEEYGVLRVLKKRYENSADRDFSMIS